MIWRFTLAWPVGLALLAGVASSAAQGESTNSLIASRATGNRVPAGITSPQVESSGSFVTGGSDAAAGIYRMQDAGESAPGAGSIISAGLYEERSGGVAIVNNPPVVKQPELAFAGRPDWLNEFYHDQVLSVSETFDVDGDPISFHIHRLAGGLWASNRFVVDTSFTKGQLLQWIPPVPVLGVDLFLTGIADDGRGLSSQTINVRGHFVPIVRIQEATNRTAKLSDPVTLEMVVDGTGPLTNQWFRNGAPMNGRTFARLDLGAVQRSDAGVYVLNVSNAYGSASSHDVNFRVLIPQQLLAPEVLPDGTFRIRFGDFDGQLVNHFSADDYDVQWSTNLQTWLSLTNATLQLDSGVVKFEDSSTPSTHRFYRVVSD